MSHFTRDRSAVFDAYSFLLFDYHYNCTYFTKLENGYKEINRETSTTRESSGEERWVEWRGEVARRGIKER